VPTDQPNASKMIEEEEDELYATTSNRSRADIALAMLSRVLKPDHSSRSSSGWHWIILIDANGVLKV
jgi:hypothetical protein